MESHSGYNIGWRTDRYRRFLPELDSCKELKNDCSIKTSPEAQSSADKLELMLHTASINRTLVEAYMEDMAVRRDTLREGDLAIAKIEDYNRERNEDQNHIVTSVQKHRTEATKYPQPPELRESKLLLLNDISVERYGKKGSKKKTVKKESSLKTRSPSPTRIFFTESPDKPTVCVKKANKEERWEPLSYSAMGDLGFNFRIAPGEGQLWGKTTKMWKPNI
ncbi:hypothetical protein LOD99_13080 [Oopsacas minuta]|uniref:Uncharacterized protein n=1 Tax=Oopsacas minuta TaxID=111878 RepID=A0AAV7JAX5_9METZ|nr:hypothetical protein LOD99_13080 [Oopsacas minuta]